MKTKILLPVVFLLSLLFTSGCKKAEDPTPSGNPPVVTMFPFGETTYTQPFWQKWHATGVSSISVTQNGLKISEKMIDSVWIENPTSTQIFELQATAYDGTPIPRESKIIVNGPPPTPTLLIHSKGNILFNEEDTLFYDATNTTALNQVSPEGNRTPISPVNKGFIPMGKRKHNVVYRVEAIGPGGTTQKETSTAVGPALPVNYNCDYGMFVGSKFEMKRDWSPTWETPPFPPLFAQTFLEYKKNGDLFTHFDGGNSYLHWLSVSPDSTKYWNSGYSITKKDVTLDSIMRVEEYRGPYDSAGFLKTVTYRKTYVHPAKK